MSNKTKVKALANIRVDGKRLDFGSTYEIPNRDADFLIRAGRVEEVVKKAKEKGPMTTKSAGATIA